MTADQIAVISFLMLYAGMFIALDAVTVWFVSWLWDHDWFWLTAVAVGVLILMANLRY